MHRIYDNKKKNRHYIAIGSAESHTDLFQIEQPGFYASYDSANLFTNLPPTCSNVFAMIIDSTGSEWRNITLLDDNGVCFKTHFNASTNTWESWRADKHTRSNWYSLGVQHDISGQLGWANYADGHIIFDASKGISPTGSAIDKNNCTVPWSSSYPMLVGYNGANTYGVKVDTARYANTAAVLNSMSDARDKTDVEDLKVGLDFINNLRPVSFRWDRRRDYINHENMMNEIIMVNKSRNTDEVKKEMIKNIEGKHSVINVIKDGSKKEEKLHYGLIAQELKSTMDKFDIDFGGFHDNNEDGYEDFYSIHYDELVPILIKSIQELTSKVNDLESKLKKEV